MILFLEVSRVPSSKSILQGYPSKRMYKILQASANKESLEFAVMFHGCVVEYAWFTCAI